MAGPFSSLPQTVSDALSRSGLPGPFRRVLVAVSGGADSTALALLLHRLWPPLGVSLAIAHIDHSLPEAEPPGTVAHVRRLADSLDLPFLLRVVDVRAAMAATGESLEMAARRLRRAALLDAARTFHADAIALGHNADDQAETLLLRLARGTGPRGLGGMAAVAPADRPQPGEPALLRPLLACPRATLRAWLRGQSVPWLDDPTNALDDVPRNRLRHRVLPALYEALGESARDGLLRTARLLRDEEDLWLGPLVRDALAACRLPDNGALDLAALRKEPLPLQRRVLLLALQESALPPEFQTYATVERLLRLSAAPAAGSASLDLGGGIQARRSYDRLSLGAPVATPPQRSTLAVAPATGFQKTPRGDPFQRPLAAYLSRSAVPCPSALVVRPFRPGDRLRPIGADGSRKIADILVDRKIPAARRAAVEVVCAGDRVAWLPGHSVDAAFAVPSPDAPSWRVTLHPLETP